MAINNFMSLHSHLQDLRAHPRPGLIDALANAFRGNPHGVRRGLGQV
jgi:hypothetical protein